MSGDAVNIGSSRGATQLFEKYHKHFVETPEKRMTPLVSPTTTLGNISSWVAYDLGVEGATLSHSITCSTALHGVLNACAWLKGGMAERFLVGGSEAPLTDFTVAQMRSLGIYSKKNDTWPCAPLEEGKSENTMVLGEGASVFALENDNGQKALGRIVGLGYATEIIEHNASLSVNADCMQKSMRMALEDAEIDTVDVVVMHAPGTCQGDESELRAVESVFKDKEVHLVSTKHHTGHTLGASGGLSVDLALEMIERGSGKYSLSNVSKTEECGTSNCHGKCCGIWRKCGKYNYSKGLSIFVLLSRNMDKKWTKEAVLEIYNKPLMELLYEAATVHRKNHNPLEVQISTLLSIKTGGCPEDCGYCPQAARYHTDIETNNLMSVSQVIAQALRAKSNGSSRLCMGAAWRNIQNNEEFDQVLEMVKTVNDLEMEVCCTLGMMTQEQPKD